MNEQDLFNLQAAVDNAVAAVSGLQYKVKQAIATIEEMQRENTRLVRQTQPPEEQPVVEEESDDDEEDDEPEEDDEE